jgi:putative membrane protein
MKNLLITILSLQLLAAPVALAQATMGKATSAYATRGAIAAEFIDKAGSGGMFAVLSSDLALNKATDARVKELARRLATERRAANDRLVSTLRSAQLPPPPTGLDPEHQEIMDKLSTASGREFDRAYLDAQVQAHEDVVELFASYAKEGDNAELKSFAQQTLPTLEDHFKHVQRLDSTNSWRATIREP